MAGLPPVPDLMDRAVRGDALAAYQLSRRLSVDSLTDLITLFWDEVKGADRERVFEACAFAFDLYARKIPEKDALTQLQSAALAEAASIEAI